MSARAKLILALLAVVAVFLVGTAGFMFFERELEPSLGDAAYMTAITLSTVGYTEVWELSPAGRAWTVIVIVLGITTVSIAFTSLITVFVSGEIQFLRGRKKLEARIDKLSGHVIICGHGRMGKLAAMELAQKGIPIVIIERDPGTEADLREEGHLYVIGDATDEDVLVRAGVTRARALVAVLPHDGDNVYVTLTTRTFCPDLQIIARAEQPRAEIKLKRAGASRVICPQVVGAKRIGDILTRPNVTDFFEVAAKGVDLEVDEYTLGANTKLAGLSLREACLREKAGATVVAVRRPGGDILYSPGPDVVLQTGDTLIMIGPARISTRLDELDDGV